MTTPRRFHSIDAVAQICGVSVSTVRRWAAAGEFPVHRLGRQIRIDPLDLARFLDGCRQRGASDA